MRVSVIQMNPGSDKQENIAQAGRLIGAAVAADRPDIVSLPEVWTCLGGSRAGKFAQAETLPPAGSNEAGGPAYEFLRSVARSQGIHVHGGSLGELGGGELGGERLFNTTVVFGPDGEELARYRKIHLFDITAPDGTGFRESATYAGGDAIVTYQAGGRKVGCAICYDLRFPEMFLALRRAGAELIFLPSNFAMQTGKDHWDVLIRARAIDSQCWIAAPATCGRYSADGGSDLRWAYGHSLLCDPWGHIVAKVSDGIGWATARIDAGVTERVRRDMPLLEHRRLT
jgi:predicted amidohydrolase